MKQSICHYEKNKFDKRKETIVFLHGLTGHSGVWDSYFKHFGKKYNVIRIDFIGHGRSPRPFSFHRYSIESLTEELSKILDKNKITSAHFVAHSYSFLVFLELLKSKKNLVKSSIFISPYYPNRKRISWRLSRMATIPLAALVYFLPTMKRYSLVDYRVNSITDDFDIRRVISDTLSTGIKSYVALNYYSLRYNHENLVKKIKVPILIVTGEKDTIIPLNDVKNIAKKIKSSKLVVLKNKAHVIVYPFHKEITSVMDKFFKSH